MSYESMSQEQLARELDRLLAERRAPTTAEGMVTDSTWATHELSLLRVELEMQNRELHRTQRETEEAKNRYRRLYDFAPVGYCSLDREGRIVELNLTAAGILRTERAVCVGGRFEDLFPPLKLDSFRTHLAACESRRAQVTSDIWLAIETRGWVPLEFRSEPELDGDELIGFNTIITERQREEDARRLVEDVRRILVNSSPHRVNLQGIAELVASRFCDVCIIESLDVLGALSILGAHGSTSAMRVVREGRMHPNRPILHGAPNVARTGDPEMETFRHSALEARVDLDDDYCPLLRQLAVSAYICVPLRAKTTLLGVMTLVMRETGRGYDERDLRLALELASSIAWVLENARQLAETQRQIQLRQDLLALVAHDLRTPLNALRVAAELSLMNEQCVPREAEIVRRSVDTMARMIEDLLDFSSVEAGRLSIQRERCNLMSLLSAATDMLRSNADKKGVELVIDSDVPAVDVVCDRHRILQVLNNLGDNALKFTEKGSVCFGAVVRGAEVEVWVHDSGPGIPTELLPHVFERYWRPRRDTRRSGRGLGLFIVRGIVEGHDGRIWVESEQGKGSRFTFTLPLSFATEMPVPSEPRPEKMARDCNLLIIEDDAESRSLLRDVLVRKSFRVHTAGNGREALDVARLIKPALMLLDLSMPTMDGAQFVRMVRSDDALRRVPIILVSGDVDLPGTARQLRVAGYVPKPIQVDALLRTIESVLG